MSPDCRRSAIIVGASLSGLATALSLANQALEVSVVERVAPNGLTGGGGLGVDLDVLARVVGHDPSGSDDPLPVLRDHSHDNVAWTDLHQWLTKMVAADWRVEVHYSTEISTVGSDDDRAWVATTKGSRFSADLVVGAAGYHSVVRRYVDPGVRPRSLAAISSGGDWSTNRPLARARRCHLATRIDRAGPAPTELCLV
jgi:2-polyprenyl-6-methoxyphenol hydroxylase-like FAD-dependent oxidoreductase